MVAPLAWWSSQQIWLPKAELPSTQRMLYMAAVSAIRHNPDLARKYAELRERGKPPKVALTAIMRKLVVLANALLKQDRLWTPSPATATG